jgi:uncharacterized membrane protein
MTDQPGPKPSTADSEPVPTIEELLADLETVAGDRADAQTQAERRDVEHLLLEAYERGLIESGVRDLGQRDAAEALVGSVIFASPLLVEDGIFDIADHLFDVAVAGVPVFLLANTLFVVVMTYALLQWTGRDTDETALLFGHVPARLVMTLAVSLLVATALMTVWGRVDGWQSPLAALARINVIWTVGSLGAALGDILADDAPAVASSPTLDDSPAVAAKRPQAIREMRDSALVAALHEQFDDLESVVDDTGERQAVNRIRERSVQATVEDTLGDRIQKYTSRDIAEGFVGSIFFAIPFLVEDGVFDVAEYFLSFQVGVFPVFFLLNTVFVLLMILALVYWAGPQDVRVNRPLLGVIPRRLIGIALVSLLTTAALMTMWGRVAWEDPVVALARVSVVWTVASFGAALGDILPGESSGADINDDLAALADQND